MTPIEVVCPECGVPFLRYGPGSSGFYVKVPDVCIVCREGLDPAAWLPAKELTEPGQAGKSQSLGTQAAPGCEAGVSPRAGSVSTNISNPEAIS